MCNLNILIKNNNIKKEEYKDLLTFFMGVTCNSYANNKDGDGLFCSSGFLIKNAKKINVFDYATELINSNFIISHQRLATSGLTTDYTQPFYNEKNKIVLVHNGIMNDFLKPNDKHSDTFGFFNKIISCFENKAGNREEKIILSIKENLDFKNSGLSYSIALYDLIANCLYYFKNEKTNIEFHKNKDLLYITTSYTNSNLLNLFENRNFTELKNIKDYVIYKIFIDNNKIKLKKVGLIKKPKIETQKLNLFDEKKKNKKHIKNYNCQYCIKPATKYIKDYGFLCSSCYNELGFNTDYGYPKTDYKPDYSNNPIYW